MKKLLIVIALLLAGCASTKTATSWQGRNVNDLIAAWGPPDSAASLSDGRRVLSYTQQFVYGGVSSVCRASFVVSPNEVVQQARLDGPNGACNALLRGRPGAEK